MENNLNLESLKPLKEQLENYCSEIKLDTCLNYNKNSGTIFSIKINNKLSRNLVNSLVQNIINIKENSFYSIIANKENGTIKFSFLANRGEENKFLNNLLNFIKIIKLNKLFSTETNTLEQTVPVKIIQTFRIVDEQKLPNLCVSYILSSNQISIDNKLFSLNDGISVMNNIQNNPNFTTKFFNLNSTNADYKDFRISNLKNFCKTAQVGFNAVSNFSNVFVFSDSST